MSYFKDLPSNPNFPELEVQIMNWWYQNDLVSQYLHKNDNSEKQFSFIDGPITANGPMGVHHARGRTLKDLFQRFKNAQGYAQRFQNGFDCQGLWVEVEVEKENGFNSKKDIQEFGLANFTNACLARVDKYSKIQTEQSKRLAMFMDWDNSYYTNSQTNNLYIWHFLKVVQQKGWLTKKKSATTWCPRCETGLSQHEEADGYKEVTDTSVYVKFKLKDRDEYVLAWTTTPWTLSANVLLAINTDFEYVKAKIDNQTVYLGKSAADRLGINDYEKVDPQTLLNLEYESLYNIPAQQGVKHYITNWELVSDTDGSGVVHIAPGCGQEDFELGKTLGAAMIAPLDTRGYFLEGYGDLTGKYAHDVAPMVFDYLKSIGALYKTESITHRYPHCWRCKTKCLFRLEDNWYMKSDEIRPLLKEAAAKVHFHPKYAARRMQNWLDTMEDWMISRKRFYGLALPFYECKKCNELTVVGGKEELKQLAVKPEIVDQLPSFHRPWIDDIKIKCPHCGEEVSRITDVGDVWLDAGIVPYSTLKYLDDKNYWQKWFPADLVLEMTEQIRLWFYSMLFMSVTLEGVTPYTTVVTYAEVRDEKGEKMSKTKKNGIPYDDAVSKMGVDAMRWLYCQQKPPANVSFGYNIADKVKRDFMLILWNSYRFFTQHANMDNWVPADTFVPSSDNVMDQWIVSRLHHTIKKAGDTLEKFSTAAATKAIEEFVSDLSTWYIRRNRDRSDNLGLLYYVFQQLSVVLAPFVPYLSEVLYQNLKGFEVASSNITVHTQNWPTFDEKYLNPQLEENMKVVRDITQLVHGERQKAAIKVRQPLNQVVVTTPNKLPDNLVQIIADETNVKTVKLVNGANFSVDLDTQITPGLQAEGEYRDLVRQIQVLRREQNLNLTDKISIVAPTWPANFEKEILSKTLAVSISKGTELSIEKV